MTTRFQEAMNRWRGLVRASHDLRPYESRLAAINALEATMSRLSDPDLLARAQRLSGGDLPDVTETFALVREASRRAVGMRPYDVQVIGALVLDEGKLAEMQTGEGKTLVAVMPAIRRALGGVRTHILTFNDYLARRDAAWMGPIYELLGVRVGHVQDGMSGAQRRDAYSADVTYLTAKQAGFDYLRDGLVYDTDDRVHQGFAYAIVDEADSLLIDEARIPLVIAGNRGDGPHNATRMNALAQRLGLGLDYETDGERRNIFLTEAGQRRVQTELGCGELHSEENGQWLAEIRLALHANELLQRDVDYIVRDGAIELVDALTGRAVPDRHWPDGLQTALEAKEGLRFRREGVVLGSVTLEHLLGFYDDCAGMTATAVPQEEELREAYKLDVVVLPMHAPCLRKDLPDRIFTHREAKLDAIVGEVAACRETGRPVLVGTASVRESEELAARLRRDGFECSVLNAKTDQLEAEIIAEAGAAGAVTISTNMAGRGTDIRLGGADERGRDEVVAAGGLYVIGTCRHESRRIDRQLRGRAGRQGDPGSSELFISLEDVLVTTYGVDALIPARHRTQRATRLDHPIVGRRIDWGQQVVEQRNFSTRKTLRDYSSLVHKQHMIAREMRDEALIGEDLSDRRRLATLHALDRFWQEHIGLIADLREGIHMVRLGHQDPLLTFMRGADRGFRDGVAALPGVVDALEASLNSGEELRGPSSTWTYLVDDDPFRSALGLHVSGNLALSLGAALYSPLYMAAALWTRLRRRRG